MHSPDGGAVTFVVARPQGDGGMVTQTAHGSFRLGAQDPVEILILGIVGASHHEVVPQHDAFPVAEIVENIRFIDAAAPDAQHIAVQIRRHFHNFHQAVGVPEVHGVRRDMIGAEDADRLAVDDELEIRSLALGPDRIGKEPDLADAGSETLLRQHLPGRFADKTCGALVEIGLAVVAGPP